MADCFCRFFDALDCEGRLKQVFVVSDLLRAQTARKEGGPQQRERPDTGSGPNAHDVAPILIASTDSNSSRSRWRGSTPQAHTATIWTASGCDTLAGVACYLLRMHCPNQFNRALAGTAG